ncbi:response regulator [soil metagenome]
MKRATKNLIYLIDDDLDDLEFLVEAFSENSSFRIETFLDALACLDKLHSINNPEEFPDLIISDYNMPKMNGLELLIKIKTDEALKHLDFIIFSTSTHQEVERRCFENGGLDYLTKLLNLGDYKIFIEKINQRINSSNSSQ